MKENNSHRQIFRALNLDLFGVEKLQLGVILLRVNIAHITHEEIDLFIDTISILYYEGHKEIIIDLSETESLDELSCNLLIEKIIEISTNGGSIRLLVTEENPRLPFSIGMAISELNVYLNLKSALNDLKTNLQKSR